ncbi:MAG: hypothetical protein ACLT40_10450 [Fusobacterium sp.]
MNELLQYKRKYEIKKKMHGKSNVLRDIGLFCIGYNFNRYISRSLRNCKRTTLHSLQAA